MADFKIGFDQNKYPFSGAMEDLFQGVTGELISDEGIMKHKIEKAFRHSDSKNLERVKFAVMDKYNKTFWIGEIHNGLVVEMRQGR